MGVKKLLNNEKSLKDFEKTLGYETYHCTRMAYHHQQAKEICAALKIKVKEIKERIKKEAENVKK